MSDSAKILIPLEELIDKEKETERLEGEKKRLTGEIERLTKKLSNPGFTEKAPEKVVASEREKKAKYEQMKEQVETQLKNFKK